MAKQLNLRKRALNKAPTIGLFILKTLTEIGRGTFEAFFPPQYAFTKAWREAFGIDPPIYPSQHTAQKILIRLQHQGLIEKDKKYWHITKHGQTLFRQSRYSIVADLPQRDNVVRLVIFDIPERERNKRAWLRIELTTHEFYPIQKSVWLGVRPLSREFYKKLHLLNIKQYIHILSVQKPGTLSIE